MGLLQLRNPPVDFDSLVAQGLLQAAFQLRLLGLQAVNARK